MTFPVQFSITVNFADLFECHCSFIWLMCSLILHISWNVRKKELAGVWLSVCACESGEFWAHATHDLGLSTRYTWNIESNEFVLILWITWWRISPCLAVITNDDEHLPGWLDPTYAVRLVKSRWTQTIVALSHMIYRDINSETLIDFDNCHAAENKPLFKCVHLIDLIRCSLVLFCS